MSMQSFDEQLSAARGAKGMTQQELATAMNVTRQTISSWETGRTMPDINTIYRLSEVLDCAFLPASGAWKPSETEASELSQTDAEVQAPESPLSETEAVPSARKPRVRRIWLALGAAAVLCACAIGLWALLRGQAPAADAFPVELYRQSTPNEAGKAHLTFENKVWEEAGGNTVYARYAFTMDEDNGVGFDISRLEVQLEGKTGKNRGVAMSAEDLRVANLDPHIEPNGSMTIDGGFPKGEFLRVGIAVHGVDGNGEELVFYDLIEM